MITITKNIKYSLLGFMLLCALGFGYISFFFSGAVDIKPFDKAVEQLSSDILDKCEQKGWKGTILEFKTIDGPVQDTYLNNKVIPDLTCAIMNSKKKVLTFIIPPEEYQETVKNLRKVLISKGVNDDEIAAIIIDRASNAKYAPDLTAELKWSIEDKEKQHIQLVLKVSKAENIESSVIFTHPLFMQEYNRKVSVYGFARMLLIVLGLLAFLLYISQAVIVFVRGKLFKLEPTLVQLENYYKRGSFIAAETLVNQALGALPGNSELVAFRQRLLTRTKNNPGKAEEVYLQYMLIMTKLQQNAPLTEEEYENFRNMDKYLVEREIAASLAKYENFARLHELNMQLENKTENIKSLLESGNISAAEAEQEKLMKGKEITELERLRKSTAGDNSTGMLLLNSGSEPQDYREKVTSFSGEISRIREESERLFGEAKEFLKGEDLSSYVASLNNILKINKEYPEAAARLECVEKSKNTEKFALVPQKTGKKVIVLKKDTVTFGRKSVDVNPDVNLDNLSISRKHLKLFITGNAVIAEDEGSKLGTFCGNEKITRTQLEEGSVLDLAHIVQMTVHFSRSGEGARQQLTSPAFTADSPSYKKGRKEKKGIGGLFIESMSDPVKKDFIVVRDSVSIAFTKIGIECGKTDDFRILLRDDILLLVTPDDAIVLYPSCSFSFGGQEYKVTVDRGE